MMAVGKKHGLKCAVLTVGLFAASAGNWAGYLRLSGNFHAVEEGVIYRSAQLSGDDFQNRIRTYGIRTIINLRGENSGTLALRYPFPATWPAHD
jgi:hypothetical protein